MKVGDEKFSSSVAGCWLSCCLPSSLFAALFRFQTALTQKIECLNFIESKTKMSGALLLKSVVLVVTLLCTQGIYAQAPAQSVNIERQVKAAYLYKFASYVEWPPSAFNSSNSPLVIGVIGADAVADELEHIVAGHTVNGRTVIARKLKRGESLAGLHMLFIGHLEKTHLLEIFSEAKNKPLLTITESEDAHVLGSMINFVVTDDRLRFEVALAPVESGGLKISARMLTAAYKVRPVAS